MLNGGDITLVSFAICFFLAVIALASRELWQGLALQITGQIFVANLRKRSFAKAQRLSMEFLDRG